MHSSEERNYLAFISDVS